MGKTSLLPDGWLDDPDWKISLKEFTAWHNGCFGLPPAAVDVTEMAEQICNRGFVALPEDFDSKEADQAERAVNALAEAGGCKIIETKSGRFATLANAPLTKWATPQAKEAASHPEDLVWVFVHKPAGNLEGMIDFKATAGRDEPSAFDRCRAYLEKIPDAVSGSGGHNATLRAAAECFRFGLTEAEAWSQLLWFNATKCQPPWNERELRHKLTEGRKLVDRDGKFGVKLDEGNDMSYQPAYATPAHVEPEAESSPAANGGAQSVRELVACYHELRPPVIHGLLRQGETMNIIAPPKAGKSWLVIDLAIAIASGRMWLDSFAVERGKVLLIDNELHSETSADRIPKVGSARGVPFDEYADDVKVHNLRGELKDLFGMAGYFNSIEPGTYKIIILDAFYRFLPASESENDNALMASLYNFLDQQAARLKCSFVLIHHTSKGLQSGKSVTDVGAGAGSQSRAADAHLVLRQHEEDGAMVLDAVVRSWKPVDPVPLRWCFPIWKADTGLDPTQLASGRKKKVKADKPEKPAKGELTPEAFAAAYITDRPATKEEIRLAAIDSGLSIRKFSEMLRLAVATGYAFEWKTAANKPSLFASIPKPLPQVLSN